MIGSTKRKTLILLGLVMQLIMIVAARLPGLERRSGMPLPRLQGGQVVAAPIEEEGVVSVSVNKFAIVLIALVFAGALLYSIYRLLIGINWQFLPVLVKSR